MIAIKPGPQKPRVMWEAFMSFRVVLLAAAAALLAAPSAANAQPLDFAVYRSSVEPIFLTKRDGYTRCVVCHGGSTNSFNLIRLRPGVNTYTEEQSRKNFEVVSRLVVPGKPEDSHLLTYPLVPQEGGAAYHSGGRQWPSKSDPNWQAIAKWVNGQK
jgi:hypothetical protein